MLDAFAGLLVELHLAGCFWGDCSLSNVLYRYDAGAIEAVMVDAETSRLHDELSRGQRYEDLDIMQVNLAGDMADIAASEGYDLDEADLEIGFDITERYALLWHELTTDLVIRPDERYRIRQRIRSLNDLGFAADDVEMSPEGSSQRVRISVRVGGRTFHSQRLREIAGIDAAENQARQILSDVAYHEAMYREQGEGRSLTDKSVATMHWRMTLFEPLTKRISQLREHDDPVQGYCNFLNFRYNLAVSRGQDVDSEAAFEEWVAAGMPGFDPALTSQESETLR